MKPSPARRGHVFLPTTRVVPHNRRLEQPPRFLLRVFALLNGRNVPFVVLRNFDTVFESTNSDVDLFSSDPEAIFTASQNAAHDTGFRLIQQVRFINHSWVWWNGGSECVRVDVDTALRWRVFEDPKTAGVLSRRVRHDEFWIPAIEDQIVILRLQIACRNLPEDRYHRRLAELGAPPCDPAIERRRLLAANLLNPLRWLRMVRFFISDLVRYVRRWSQPPGLVVRVVAAREFPHEALQDALAVLTPRVASPGRDAPFSIRRALFQCRLAQIKVRVSGDAELAARARERIPGDPARQFIVAVESSGQFHAAHVESGLMASGYCHDDGESAPLAHFVCRCLARANESAETKRRGLAVLLAGVDGAGKSTFARNLCVRAGHSDRFSGCRYFHWIPRLRNSAEFPWPVFVDQPRHHGRASRFVSFLRLYKNVILARLAWTFRVAPLLRTGRLVILDRFISNYWLDPASVRYAGGARMLAVARKLLPKPDVLIALDADAAILRQRKGELSLEQIVEQQHRLRALPPLAHQRLDLDAAIPPDELARMAFEKLAAME